MQKKTVREGLSLERVARLSRIVGSELGQRLEGMIKEEQDTPFKESCPCEQNTQGCCRYFKN